MHRLFVALRPPRPLRAALFAAMGDVEGARWQDDDQLHLTLRFIGAVDRRMADDVADALDGLRAPPVALVLGAPGRFERRGRMDSLWVGAGPGDALAALHRKVDHALVRIGLPAEGRAFVPHVTVARFGRVAGDPAGFLARAASLAGLTATVTGFALFESHLGHDGAFYEAVAHYPLSG